MSGYPSLIVPVGHVEPVPRRLRGFWHGWAVFDTLNAVSVWEKPAYPQYQVPRADCDLGIVEELLATGAAGPGIEGHVRIEWSGWAGWSWPFRRP